VAQDPDPRADVARADVQHHRLRQIKLSITNCLQADVDSGGEGPPARRQQSHPARRRGALHPTQIDGHAGNRRRRGDRPLQALQTTHLYRTTRGERVERIANLETALVERSRDDDAGTPRHERTIQPQSDRRVRITWKRSTGEVVDRGAQLGHTRARDRADGDSGNLPK
jgi:hypothetical protein